MKILLDECVPRKLKDSLAGHNCRTVPEAGLAGKSNGELLLLAEQEGFEVFLTLDQGIEYQQHLRGRKLGVLLLAGKSSRLSDLLPLVPSCLSALSSVEPGQLICIRG